MGSPKGRNIINWRTPAGRLARALLHELKIKDPRLNAHSLAARFFFLWPDCQNHFDQPITAHKLWDRWDKGVRPDTPKQKYSNEHPDKNVETKKYLP